MLRDAEVAHRAHRNLADAVRRALLDVGELAVLGDLAAAEPSPAAMLDRGFDDDGIVIVALGALAAPREGPGELPSGRDFASIKSARRPPLLVDSGLELLGVDEVPPTALERELGGRVPRHADGRGIERCRLDIPAVLVGLAAVEPADLELDPVEHD